MQESKTITELTRLSDLLRQSVSVYKNKQSPNSPDVELVLGFIEETAFYQPWFIPEHLCIALSDLASELIKLEKFPENKHFFSEIGVLMRADAPLEGITELVYLAVSGFNLQVIVPVKMQQYFQGILRILEISPLIKNKIKISENYFSGIQAIVAFSEFNSTMNSYLSKYPLLQIYRKGLSFILTGTESDEVLSHIVFRICMFFGRSQSSIKVLFVPVNYSMEPLIRQFDQYSDQLIYHKYFNNYEYRKSVMLINQIPHETAGPLLITEDPGQAGFTGVLCIQKYTTESEINKSSLTASFPLLTKHEEASEELTGCFSGVAANIENIYRFILQD